MYHFPLIPLTLENVRCLSKPDTHPPINEGTDCFQACHPYKLRIDMDRNFTWVDFHLACILEDSFPTPADFIPTAYRFPTRVNALHPIRMQPDFLHHVDTQMAHGLIKLYVYLFNALSFRHCYSLSSASWCSPSAFTFLLKAR